MADAITTTTTTTTTQPEFEDDDGDAVDEGDADDDDDDEDVDFGIERKEQSALFLILPTRASSEFYTHRKRPGIKCTRSHTLARSQTTRAQFFWS